MIVEYIEIDEEITLIGPFYIVEVCDANDS